MRWSTRIVAVLSMVALSGCTSLTGAATPVATVHPAVNPPATTARKNPAGNPAPTAPGATLDGTLAAFYTIPSPLEPASAGTIIRSAVIPSAGSLAQGATAYRVLYHSESITGSDIAVSGMIVVPGGAPPADGFPVVTWAHGTTGLAQQCAPSLEGATSIPLVNALLDRRVIVAATDYQGLGASSVQPYLVGQSEAQAVLDAARAARYLVGSEASNEVVILGYSQGGQAALFASQIAPTYAPELAVAGAAAAAPVTSLGEFVPSGSGSGDDPSSVYAVMALDAWSTVYGNLELPSVLTPTALRLASMIPSECSGALAASFDTTDTGQLFQPGWDQSPWLEADMLQNQPGRSPSPTPLLVVAGTKDTLTPYPTIEAFVTDALCRADRDTVEFVPLVGAGHGAVMSSGALVILQWISDRLSGAQATDSCL
jgi:pimeloyl-ACP methyl ester carboxylesterase